jgi:hypothetical protein
MCCTLFTSTSRVQAAGGDWLPKHRDTPEMGEAAHDQDRDFPHDGSDAERSEMLVALRCECGCGVDG